MSPFTQPMLLIALAIAGGPSGPPPAAWDIRGWQDLARTALAQGRLDTAITALEMAAQVRPDLPQVHDQLAQALAQQMHYSEAVREYQHALALAPGATPVRRELALALQNLGQLEPAARELETCISLAPGDAEAHYLLALTLSQMASDERRCALIESELAVTLQIEPCHPGALYLLGMVRMRQGDGERALAPLRTLTTIAPRFAAGHYALGTALLRSGNDAGGRQSLATFARLQTFERALEQVTRAIQREPLAPEHPYRAARLFLEQGQRDAAWPFLMRVVALAPDHVGARRDLGELLLDAAQPSQAIACLAPAASANPEDSGVWLLLARAHAVVGDPCAAEQELRRCVSQAPAWALPHYHLAQLLARTGRHTEALAELTTYQHMTRREPCTDELQ